MTRDRIRKLLSVGGLLCLAAVVMCSAGEATESGDCHRLSWIKRWPWPPASTCQDPPIEGRDPRPNFVVVLSDDQRADSLGPIHALSGQAMPQVQARLAAHGVTFTNAFATTPLCGPSRATLLTGLYAHNHGVKYNNGPGNGVYAFDDSDTLATRLHSVGYQTSYVGKYINQYQGLAIPPGWDDWHVLSGQPKYYDYDINNNGTMFHRGNAPGDYSTDVLTTKAVNFIAGASGPFFMVFAPYGPHLPSTPAPRHIGELDGLPDWRPPSYNEPDVSDKAPWLRAVPQMDAGLRAKLDGVRQAQIETALAIDDAVAAILDALEAKGVMGDTVVIYTSDNGWSWGEHRVLEKNSAFEESAKVAMVVRYDPLTSGSEDGRLVANVDIAPTLLDLAGIPSATDGMSLVPLMDGSAGSWRDSVLLEHWQADPSKIRRDPPEYVAMRGEGYLYVDYASGSEGEELYDLNSDPWQLNNLSNAPAFQAKKAELRDGTSGTPPIVGDQP